MECDQCEHLDRENYRLVSEMAAAVDYADECDQMHGELVRMCAALHWRAFELYMSTMERGPVVHTRGLALGINTAAEAIGATLRGE